MVDLTLENKAVEALITKKASTPASERETVKYLVGEEGLAAQMACRYVGLARASFYRRPADMAQRDAPVVDVLNQIVAKHGRWDFKLCFYCMRNHGYTWNYKKV